MEPGFFRSPQFLVSLVVALLLLAGAAATYAFLGSDDAVFGNGSRAACDPISLAGAPLATPAAFDSTSGDVRTVSYDVNATNATRLALVATCTTVGDVVVEPSPDALAHVTFTIRSDSSRGLADTQVALALAKRASDGALQLAAWESRAGRSGTVFDHHGSSVDVAIRVPELGAPDVDAKSDVGDVLVSQLLVGNVTLRTDVGKARAVGVDLTGNVTMSSDVHGLELRAASVQAGRIRLRGDVGDVVVQLPARADVGYDVTAKSDVGKASVEIGPTELRDSHSDGSGADVHARTQGYAGKPTQVVIDVATDVGDVTVTAG